jgi:hypothetical protein
MREVRRVGDTRDIKTDVRLIAASNRDLETAVRDGVMREDLFYRLNVIPIQLPPLRERHEDIPLLVAHFVQRFSKELDKDVRGVTPDALSVLERHHWPGNIRELENAIERAIVLGSGDMLGVDALPESIDPNHPDQFMVWADRTGFLTRSEDWPEGLQFQPGPGEHWNFSWAGVPYHAVRVSHVPILDRPDSASVEPQTLTIVYASPTVRIRQQVKAALAAIASASLLMLGATTWLASWKIRRGLLPLPAPDPMTR